jgi:FkbM family methyltransferase
MRYPDRRAWLWQVRDILCDDSYGIGRLPAAPRVLDLGANVGVFSVCLRWLRPAASVLAVEPDPDNLRLLRENTASLGPERFRILDAAVGGRPGEALLGGNTSDGRRILQDGDVAVNMVPLADLLREPVDLLKMDIEGSEVAALKSAGEALRRVERAVVEYHLYAGAAGDLGELIAALETGGFDRFRLFDSRVLPRNDPRLRDYCCLVEAVRSGPSASRDESRPS